MGFIVPKMKVSATPATPQPDPAARIEEVANDVSAELDAKRKRRKGLESTLLSEKNENASATGTSLDSAKQASGDSSPTLGSGIATERKTLG